MAGNISYSDVKVLHKLLLPSAISAVFIIMLCIVIFGSTIFFTRFYSAVPVSLQSLDFLYHSSKLVPTAHDIGNKINNNQYLKDSPLFLFWCLVGLICYTIVETLLRGVKDAGEIADEFRYVNIRRNGVANELVLRTFVRVIALIGAVFLFKYTLFKLLPVSLSSVQNLSINPSYAPNWLSAFFGIIFFAICMHAVIVLIRLVFLRPRIIGSELIF